MVFFSGLPSDAAGPVADTVTPIFTSANAWPLHVAATPVATNAALIQRNADFMPLLCLPRYSIELKCLNLNPDPVVGESEFSRRKLCAASFSQACAIWDYGL